MRAIVCTQLLDDVLEMKVDSVFGDRKLIRNLFVLATVANQLQHLQLAWCQILFTQMLCDKGCYRRRNLPFACMNGSDHGEQVILWHAFENITCRSRTKCTLN